MTARVRIWAAVAALVVGLEGLGLLVIAWLEASSLIAGAVAEPASGIALIVLTLMLAAGTLAFAWGIVRDRTWGRSGAVVTQLLAVVIAYVLITGAYAPGGASAEEASAIAMPTVGWTLGVAAIVALVAIVALTRASAPQRAGDTDASKDGTS